MAEGGLVIAISYRREDSLPIAGRLYDRLQTKFGKSNVFMDFDSIPPGVDFREQIKRTIEQSNLVIALIGPKWLGEKSDKSRRIDDSNDFVRLEIAHALQCGIIVIPVLINNASMPPPEKLPPDIEGLAFRNAVTLDSGIDFHHHADRLINSICRLKDVSLKRSRLVPNSSKAYALRRESSPQAHLGAGPHRRHLSILIFAVITIAGCAAAVLWLLPEKHREGISDTAAEAIVDPPVVNTPKAGQLFAGTWEGTVDRISTDWKTELVACCRRQLIIDENESETHIWQTGPVKGVHSGLRTLIFRVNDRGISSSITVLEDDTATYTEGPGDQVMFRGILYKKKG